MSVIVGRGTSGSGRRVPGAVLDAAAAARAQVLAGRRKAAEILLAARADAADVRARARAEGREEGLAEATATIALAARERERLLASAEGDLVDLAFAVAARVIGAAAERGVVVDVARRALAAARGRQHLTVRAHPDDLAALRAADPALAAALVRARGISLREDASLARGGVVVETEAGSVDASLAAQLAALRRAIDEARP